MDSDLLSLLGIFGQLVALQEPATIGVTDGRHLNERWSPCQSPGRVTRTRKLEIAETRQAAAHFIFALVRIRSICLFEGPVCLLAGADSPAGSSFQQRQRSASPCITLSSWLLHHSSDSSHDFNALYFRRHIIPPPSAPVQNTSDVVCGVHP